MKQKNDSGGLVYRDDEAALLREWRKWCVDRVASGDLYLEFCDAVVRRNPRFDGIHIFEILDALVNAMDVGRRASA